MREESGTRVRLGFLLGAGVSLPCGAPSTTQLTDDLLRDDIQYRRASNGRYYALPSASSLQPLQGVPTVDQIGRFLRYLRDCVDSYYEGRCNAQGCIDRSPNYEDLAYLAVQISEGINRERDNPALSSFIRDVSLALSVDADSLRVRADEAVSLINDHVVNKLRRLSPRADHLECIQECCRATSSAVPILSLNHDCLIETTLRRAGVVVNDMTRQTSDGRRVLDGAPRASGANLFKLHGSLDWFLYRSLTHDSANRWHEWIGTLMTKAAETHWSHDEDRPILLIGRFNKELSYATSPFAEILSYARKSLREISLLVVSGYSFGDKAINTMLIDWIYARPERQRRILVAHKDQESLKRSARGAIRNKWDDWANAGVLLPVTSYLSELKWSDLTIHAGSEASRLDCSGRMHPLHD
jgi:SIR2-like protein